MKSRSSCRKIKSRSKGSKKQIRSRSKQLRTRASINIPKKSKDKSRSSKKFSFYAYYDAKPRVNKKLQTSKIEFENRGKSIIFSGIAKADSKQTVEKWLKSLGRVTKWIDSNRDAMEVLDYE